MFEVSFEILLLLLVAGFFAGFIDAVAGGGGLVTVPVLLIAGANPVTALATNKIQALFGSATAAITYARGGHVDLRAQSGSALIAFVASIIGALLVTVLPVDWIRLILPVVLVAIAFFFAFKKGLNDEDRVRRLSPALFAATIVPLCGAYDGLSGAGGWQFLHARVCNACRIRRAQGNGAYQAVELCLQRRCAGGFCGGCNTVVDDWSGHGACTGGRGARGQHIGAEQRRTADQTAAGCDHNHDGGQTDLGHALNYSGVEYILHFAGYEVPPEVWS